MGIFETKKKSRTLLEILQDDIESSERWIQNKRNILKASMPIIEAYKDSFDYASLSGSELNLYIKEGKELNPQIFCDCGKIGLKAIQRSSSTRYEGIIVITFL